MRRSGNNVSPHKIVDVIIPVFNQFDVVKTCIDSVIETSALNHLEVVVIDDASTDLRVQEYLKASARYRLISLFRNESNLGYTRSVNFGIGVHRDRDVLLLNSDTVVHGTWLERMREAAYSDPKIATVNPLTNASHISGYPNRTSNDGIGLEVTDAILDDLAATKNAGMYADVHTTVGFCMFVKRECICNVGLFDARHFPVGYGEESDFCYRARKIGWRHLIAGNVFVRHFDNQSFGERKSQLMSAMTTRFVALHPDCPYYDETFRTRDPLRRLRVGLDLARIKRLVSPRNEIAMRVLPTANETPTAAEAFELAYCSHKGHVSLIGRDSNLFPNLETYRMPADVLKFNRVMEYLGFDTIVCTSAADLSAFELQVATARMETRLGPRLELR
jgi:GT2 family glycosyltransferase